MESSQNTELSVPVPQEQEHPVVVSLCLTLYDEESYPIKSYDIYGKRPFLQVDLDKVHFLSLKFVTMPEVLTKFTENELSTLVADMKHFVQGKEGGGVRLDFFNELTLVCSRKEYLMALPGSFWYYNVFKYNSVFISLCTPLELYEDSMDEESSSDSESAELSDEEEDEEDA